MTHTRFILLLITVIGSAGLSLWVGFLAFKATALDGSVLRSLVPLLLLGSLALRALLKGRAE
ncbi:MAG: hypothetical protein GY945_07615 [Rhodobacteraceae bacterium]|nr:hypothetical protein [Paracoccaceae bacterium]